MLQMAMRNQDQQLFRQFMKIRSGIQSLKAQQDVSPLSSRSSTPDPMHALGDSERSASPAPPRHKRKVAFRVRSSTTPSAVLQNLTKADSAAGNTAGPIGAGVTSPVISPIRRSPAFSMADYGHRSSGLPMRQRSGSGSAGNNDWDFISSNTKKDAETFMSELQHNLSGKSKGRLEAGSTAVGKPIFHSPQHSTLPSVTLSAAGYGSPAHSRSASNPVAVSVLDANEDSSEC